MCAGGTPSSGVPSCQPTLYMASKETYKIQPSVTLESRVEVTIPTLRTASAICHPSLAEKPCMRDSPRSVTVTHPRTNRSWRCLTWRNQLAWCNTNETANDGQINFEILFSLMGLLFHNLRVGWSYCNSLYNGISQANLNKIQRIQNTLARVVTNTSKFEHITPILKKLHWLPIKQRIDYKLCLLTYKTLQIQQPTYLYNSLSFPSHSLSTRSSDSSVLSIPYVRTSLGKGAFSVIAPRLWHSLPPDTRNSLSVSTFRSTLKTHLFKLAFPPWILSHPIIGLPTRIWFLFFLYF